MSSLNCFELNVHVIQSRPALSAKPVSCIDLWKSKLITMNLSEPLLTIKFIRLAKIFLARRETNASNVCSI